MIRYVKLTLTFLLITMVFATAVRSSLFINPPLGAYFLYLILGITFTLASCLVLLCSDKLYPKAIPLPILLFVGWTIFIFIHGRITGNYDGVRYIYFLTTCSLFVTLFFMLCMDLIHVRTVFLWIGCFSIIEAGICLLQFLGLYGSANDFFKVTGTWENPNVTAMFLAMTTPAVLLLFKSSGPKVRIVILIALFIITAAIVTLKCRTAYVGLLTFLIIWANQQYGLIHRIKNKANRSLLTVIVAILLPITILLGNFIYKTKKESAEGRKFVWKVAVRMIVAKPWAGYGYGMFERNYNISQAEYIGSGNASPNERKNAGFIRTAYNEFLESAVEGGLPGFLLFTALMISLLVLPQGQLKSEEVIFYSAGIGMFIAMSTINFTLRSIPVMLLFICYAALACSRSGIEKRKSTMWIVAIPKSANTWSRFALSLGLVIPAAYIISSQTNQPVANYKNKIAHNLLEQGQFTKAIELMNQLKNDLKTNEDFLRNYGTALLSTGNYLQAQDYYSKAKKYTSDPDLYMLSGRCYEGVKMYEEAAKEFQVASLIEPQRFLPKIALMNLYYVNQDTLKAAAMAKTILNLKPKISSARTKQYKASAKQLLVRFKQVNTVKNPLVIVPTVKPLF